MHVYCSYDFSLGNACMLKWFWDEDFFHHFCGYLVVYWKWSLPLLHIVLCITCISLNMWHTRWNNKLCERSKMFFEFAEFWRLMLLWLGCSTVFFYFQITGNIFLVSKCFYLFSLQCCFRCCCCRLVLWDFCCVWKL